jgi:hypothetical protein
MNKDKIKDQCNQVLMQLNVDNETMTPEDKQEIHKQKIKYDKWHNNNTKEDKREVPNRHVKVDITKELE